MPFASVIVDGNSGEVVGEGWNRTAMNPLWHGEIDAINQLAKLRPETDWTQLVLYTTAESCPMCQAAIMWAGIGTVVYGTSMRFLQDRGWWQIDVLAEEIVRRTPFAKCRLIGGVLVQECNVIVHPPS